MRAYRRTPQSVAAQVQALTEAGAERVFRDGFRTHTSEGSVRAKARGVNLVCKPTLTPHQRTEAIKRRVAGQESMGQIAGRHNVSRWTIQRSPA
jgi:hypothetical protein